MILEKVDESLDDKAIQELEIVIKELYCHNGIDVKHLFNYLGENNTISEILSDELIIKSVMRNDRED